MNVSHLPALPHYFYVCKAKGPGDGFSLSGICRNCWVLLRRLMNTELPAALYGTVPGSSLSWVLSDGMSVLGYPQRISLARLSDGRETHSS